MGADLLQAPVILAKNLNGTSFSPGLRLSGPPLPHIPFTLRKYPSILLPGSVT